MKYVFHFTVTSGSFIGSVQQTTFASINYKSVGFDSDWYRALIYADGFNDSAHIYLLCWPR
ncbi:hypothetical protein Hanom_Chr06g00536281 [Helianthus anomalus]